MDSVYGHVETKVSGNMSMVLLFHLQCMRRNVTQEVDMPNTEASTITLLDQDMPDTEVSTITLLDQMLSQVLM
jgi:hypothetical protein